MSGKPRDWRWPQTLARRGWWWPARRPFYRRRLALACVVVATAAMIVWWLAAPPVPERCGTFSCGVGASLTSAIVVLAVGFLGFVGWTRTRILLRYTQRIRDEERPTDLRSRRLCNALAEELRANGDQVVLLLGEAGAGKTTAMSSLREELASRGVIPVLLSLDSAEPPFDIRTLAKQRFARTIEDDIRSEAAADRLWREIWRQRLVVVLVDGFDEALTDGGIIDPAELAKDIIRKDQLPPGRLVVASRPSSVGKVTGCSAFVLDALEREELVSMLAQSDGVSRELAGELVDVLGLGVVPFYLTIVRHLLATDGARAVTGLAADRRYRRGRALQDGARRRLLDAYIEALVTRGDHNLGELAARRCVASIAEQAYSMTATGRDDLAAGQAQRELAGGRRLGLLQGDGAGSRVRFEHPLMQAYLASRALTASDAGSQVWHTMMPGAEHDRIEEALLALRLFAAGNLPPGDLDDLISMLLLDPPPLSDRTHALRVAATAIRVVASNPGSPAVTRALNRLQVAWEQAPRQEETARREAIEALADLCRGSSIRESKLGYQLMWRLSSGQTYAVRWQIVEAFARAGHDGFSAIHPRVKVLIKQIKAGDKTGLSHLSNAAAFLPAVLVGADEPAAVERELERVVELVGKLVNDSRGHAEPSGLGAEASLAQGFKLAASLPGVASWPGAGAFEQNLLKLTGDAQFWYSKVNALQALTRLGLNRLSRSGEASTITSIESVLSGATADEHQFVSHTAKLCSQALELARSSKRDEAEACLWGDDAIEVRRSGATLHDEAARLMADIVIALNMNEQGRHHGVRELDPTDLFGRAGSLPPCLSTDADRTRLLDGVCDCELKLCPYRPERARHSRAYRGLGRAFCAHQKRLSRAPVAWQPSASGRALEAFWSRMEQDYAEYRWP